MGAAILRGMAERMPARAARVAVALLVVAALASCTSAPSPVSTDAAPTAGASTPSATATAEPTVPKFEKVPDRCAATTVMVCDPELGDGVMRDLGPREFATGDFVVDAAGVPAHYVVADGDVWQVILDRIPNHGGLWGMNCYRVGGFDFWAGDIINLNPETITTVGSYQGDSSGISDEVRESCLQQTGIPPQR